MAFILKCFLIAHHNCKSWSLTVTFSHLADVLIQSELGEI